MGERAPGRRVVVVGSGVTGLTVAVRLAEAGHPVGVVAAEPWSQTTSRVAGAVWHPYLVAGPHVLRWSAESYRTFAALAAAGAPGVRMAPMRELDSAAGELGVDRAWTALVEGYRELPPGEVPDGWTGGREARVPVVDTGRYLPYLVGRLEAAGGRLRSERLASLGAAGPAAVVVNCTGLGAGPLTGDGTLRAVRGQVVVVANPGVAGTVLTDAGTYAIAHPGEVVLGGTADDVPPTAGTGTAGLTADPATAEDILARAGSLVPALAGAAVLGGRVGLRPWRPEVRLDADPVPPEGIGRLVHCYGHGGAGVTLSWGCAGDVAALVGPPAATREPPGG